jgi:polyisoprenyl-teichoic acid--peptidoglycan teichoic acid transferase
VSVAAEGPPRLARSMWKRFAVATLLISLFAAASTATAVLLEVGDGAREISVGGKPIVIPHNVITRADVGDPQTILVIGSDRRFRTRKDVHNSRSDTIILVRLNPDAKATTVMSIPRDLKVQLKPGAPPDKINAAYSLGGPAMTARVVKRVLSSPGRPFPINHIVNVNFGGFSQAVNKLGCVYADIDRNYFNDNNPPAGGGGEDYATIAVRPGYQKLCGKDALDYVRFRHLDTDIVRSARQQDFLRQAKQQYGSSKLFTNRRALGRIFGRYTQSDKELHKTTGILKLLNLVIFSGRKPVQEVRFPAILGAADDPFVTANPAEVHKAVARFLAAKGSPGPRGPTRPSRKRPKRKGKRRPSSVPGLVDAASVGEQQGTTVGAKLRFPVYYPRLITTGGRYMGPLNDVYPRAYKIKVRGKYYGAYRLVIDAGGIGEFYGVQGTRWRDPPLLRDPSEIRRVNGKKLLLFFDGSRLRFVAWRTSKAAYWISNTLLESIAPRQMVAMAASLQRIGSRR